MSGISSASLDIPCKNIFNAIAGGCGESISINKDNIVGLDQFAYVAVRAGVYQDYYDDDRAMPVTKPREIAYWRKHPNLQGWMQQLWLRKLAMPAHSSEPLQQPAPPDMFNGIELELTWEDLDQLEADIRSGQLPQTQGFFFGSDADDYYRAQDLEFVKQARAELFLGLKVFYNSSW